MTATHNTPVFIFVETNHTSASGIPLVRQLGYSPILFTNIREFYPNYYSSTQLDKFDAIYDVDTHSDDAMYAIVRALKLNVKGILSCFDNNTLAAAHVAKKLSLPHPDITGLENSLSKITVRDILAKAHILQPKFSVFDYNHPPEHPPLDFPFVMKPDNEAGSRGAFLCKTLEDYHDACKKLSTNSFTETGNERSKLLFEEYIAGDFYAAELLWDGEWQIMGIIQIIIKPETGLAISNIIFPSNLCENDIPMIKEKILRWVNAVGLKGGGLDIEFKMVDHEPILIEINPRLGGAKVNTLLTLSQGISPVEKLIYWLCGLTAPELTQQKSSQYFSNAFYFAKGHVIDIDTSNVDTTHLIMHNHKTLPFTIQPGDAMCVDQVVGDIIVAGKDFDTAIYNADQVIKNIKITTLDPERLNNESV